MDRISTFIVCRNHGKFVGKAIESIMAQQRRPYEVLLFDDASTDDSAEVMKGYLNKWPRATRFEFYPRSRQGHIALYNEAISKCQGDYIHLMAADDVLLDEFFYNNCLDLFRPSVGFVSGGLVRITAGGERTKMRVWAPNDLYGNPPRRLIMQRLAEVGNFVNGGATLCRRVALRNLGDEPYDPRCPYAADFLLWVRLLAKGWSAGFIGGDCYGYRMHDGQMTTYGRASGAELEIIYGELQAAINAYLKPQGGTPTPTKG